VNKEEAQKRAKEVMSKKFYQEMGGEAVLPRNQALDKTGKNEDDNFIMKAWFALTE